MSFATICTHDPGCLFGSILEEAMVLNSLGAIVNACARDIATHHDHVQVDALIVMPNHMHAILVIDRNNSGVTNRAPTAEIRGGAARLGEVVRAFKARCAHSVRGEIHRANERSLWQRGYYEHMIRDEYEWTRTREYIANNPTQWAMDEDNPDRKSLAASDGSHPAN